MIFVQTLNAQRRHGGHENDTHYYKSHQFTYDSIIRGPSYQDPANRKLITFAVSFSKWIKSITSELYRSATPAHVSKKSKINHSNRLTSFIKAVNYVKYVYEIKFFSLSLLLFYLTSTTNWLEIILKWIVIVLPQHSQHSHAGPWSDSFIEHNMKLCGGTITMWNDVYLFWNQFFQQHFSVQTWSDQI